MRSPLHIPASTHGHLAATELEKSFNIRSDDYELGTRTAPNRLRLPLRQLATTVPHPGTLPGIIGFSIFSENSLAFAWQSIVGFGRGLCCRVRYRRWEAGNGVNRC